MRTLPVVLLILLAAPAAQAQDRAHGPLLPTLPANTRALAMGGAFALGSSDPMSLFHNPALSNASGVSLDVQRYAGNGSTVSLASGAEWWGGRVGLGVQAASYGVTAGRLLGELQESDLAGDGPEDVTEALAAVSYGRRILGLRLALTGRLIDQRAAGDHVTNAAFDLSTGVTVSRFNLGLAVQNVGPGYDFVGLELDPPTRVTVGAAFANNLPVGPLDLVAAASVTREADGTVVPGGGIEVGYWPVAGRTFFARAGLRDPADPDAAPWTVGAGFNGDRITLDWAFVDYDRGYAHRLTLRFR